MLKKKVNKKKTNKKQDDKILFAFLATFFTIIGFIIALATKRNDKYIMFYAKQGLVLFIGYIIALFLGWIPVVGWAYWILLTIVWVLAWLNALSGEQRNTWIIGDIAKKINL